jgi:hypothetical protein
VSGFGVVAGVVALFFACGILMGVLGVMALPAIRTHGRAPRRRYPRRYAVLRAENVDRTWPRRPSGPDREDRPGWEGQRRPDEIGEPPPPWPGGRRDLAARGD